MGVYTVRDNRWYFDNITIYVCTSYHRLLHTTIIFINPKPCIRYETLCVLEECAAGSQSPCEDWSVGMRRLKSSWRHLQSTRCQYHSPKNKSPRCKRWRFPSKVKNVPFILNFKLFFFKADFQSSRTMKLTQPIKCPFQLSGPLRKEMVSMTTIISWWQEQFNVTIKPARGKTFL